MHLAQFNTVFKIQKAKILMRLSKAGIIAGMLALICIPFSVHAAKQSKKSPPAISYDLSALPQAVQDMHAEILKAAKTGHIKALQIPLELNEIPPLVSYEDEDKAIPFWIKTSADGKGREICAILVEILNAGYVKTRDKDGKEIYLWPYFAKADLNKLSPAQEVELYKLIKPAEFKKMQTAQSYTAHRLGIGADGTWHFFVAGE